MTCNDCFAATRCKYNNGKGCKWHISMDRMIDAHFYKKDGTPISTKEYHEGVR